MTTKKSVAPAGTRAYTKRRRKRKKRRVRSVSTPEQRTAWQKTYDEKNTVHVSLKLNAGTDADILSWLETQPSKQGAIRMALKEYLANQNKGES